MGIMEPDKKNYINKPGVRSVGIEEYEGESSS